MNATINFNEQKSQWEAFVGNRRIAARKTRSSLEKFVKANYQVETTQSIDFAKAETKAEFSITERFDFLTNFVKMVAKKKSNALIVTGSGGLGKSFTVIKTLKDCGLREDTIGEIDGDFIVIKGFSTAKAMYRTLWENNGKVIVFDDADSVHKDPIAANILKGALDSDEKRVITWGAEFSDKEDLPNRFEFTGRVIFISNLPMEKFPQALISRSLRVSLDMTTSEKIERIEHIVGEKSFMPNIDSEVKADVIRFIKDHAKQFNDLNMRTAIHAVQIRNGVEDYTMFQRMALYMGKA